MQLHQQLHPLLQQLLQHLHLALLVPPAVLLLQPLLHLQLLPVPRWLEQQQHGCRSHCCCCRDQQRHLLLWHRQPPLLWQLLPPVQIQWLLWLHQQWLSGLLLPYHAQQLQHHRLLMLHSHRPQG
jgi:hypothetical protein